MASKATGDLPWYADGIGFKCTQCGNCCRIEGYVWVTPEEIEEIAGFLEITVREFRELYLRDVDGHLSLIEKPNNDCIFWEEGCSVYPVRPTQCRTFPFWSENLKSPKAWDRAARDCPGMQGKKKGLHYALSEILELKSGRGETGPSRKRKPK